MVQIVGNRRKETDAVKIGSVKDDVGQDVFVVLPSK
jgi:hypothetical protein